MTSCKLIILKLLKQAAAPLSNSRISEFLLDRDYMDYFTLQQALAQMTETGHVTMTTSLNSSLYRITDEGEEVLNVLGGTLSDEVLNSIKYYLKENELEIRNSLSVVADYYQGTDSGYLARCQVREQNSTLIDLTISVPSKAQAASVCSHWKEKNQEIYAYVMKELL